MYRINLKKITVLLLLLTFYSCKKADKSTSFKAFIDLINMVDDKIQVTLIVNNFTTTSNLFYIPAIIPGTYVDLDFGQYIHNLNAEDNHGNTLKVDRKDTNTWYIHDIHKLQKITYWVDDIIERENPKKIFHGKDQMLATFGTNFEKNDNFLLNMQAVIGYFSNHKDVPYNIDISYPKNLDIASLWNNYSTITKDSIKTSSFQFDRYFSVIDNPILISNHQKITFNVDNLEIEFILFSKSEKRDVTGIKKDIKELIIKQKKYLGNFKYPKKYTIILYETPAAFHSDVGCLEHYFGTQGIFSEELGNDYLAGRVRDILSHEFFHLLTPLQLHSNQIHDFTYNNPQEMSQHLWLYEGVTEYFSNIYQVNRNIISENEFYKKLLKKYYNSKIYTDSFPLTILSKNILKKTYSREYNNVYHKGPLVAMALDIMLREKSKGENGILQLIKKLSKKYGEKRPFKDDTFIDEIINITDKDIGNFFNNHVKGGIPIPYDSIYKKVGLKLIEKEVSTNYFSHPTNNSLGVYLNRNENNKWLIGGIYPMNDWQKSIGLKKNDLLISVDNINCNSLQDIFTIIDKSLLWKNNEIIEIKVLRNQKEIILKGKAFPPKVMQLYLIEDNNNTSKKIVELRNSWLYK